MGWWKRYQAWQPETSWDRYQAWRLESRARYAATGASLGILIVFLFYLLGPFTVERALALTAIFAVLIVPVWWFWHYPRARAKSQQPSVPTRTTAA